MRFPYSIESYFRPKVTQKLGIMSVWGLGSGIILCDRDDTMRYDDITYVFLIEATLSAYAQKHGIIFHSKCHSSNCMRYRFTKSEVKVFVNTFHWYNIHDFSIVIFRCLAGNFFDC